MSRFCVIFLSLSLLFGCATKAMKESSATYPKGNREMLRLFPDCENPSANDNLCGCIDSMKILDAKTPETATQRAIEAMSEDFGYVKGQQDIAKSRQGFTGSPFSGFANDYMAASVGATNANNFHYITESLEYVYANSKSKYSLKMQKILPTLSYSSESLEMLRVAHQKFILESE